MSLALAESEIAAGKEPAVLARWGQGSIALAIWTRSAEAGLAGWLDDRAPSALPRFRFETDAASVAADLAVALSGCASLQEDVTDLAARFVAATGADALLVRLELVRGRACHLFHVDVVRARLLTTYVGAGTQYLPSHAVARTALGGGRNDAICDDPSSIVSLPRFAVGIFAGARGPGGGIVHRSPPSMRPRFLLAIDALDERRRR